MKKSKLAFLSILILSLTLFLSGCSSTTPTNQSPNANFSANPTSGDAPLEVTFNATSSFDEDGNITRYSWYFGDASTGSGKTTTYSYEEKGNYTARLIVTDNDGATDRDNQDIDVSYGGQKDTDAYGYGDANEDVHGDEASISESCEGVFEEAASVSPYQDTHEDINPAFRECETIREFKKASEKYPDALDGADPEMYIDNRCNSAPVELGSTPICKAWEDSDKESMYD